MRTVSSWLTILLWAAGNISYGQIDIVGKTERLLSKGKHSHAIELIEKNLSKDSINASAHQAKAVYYLHPSHYNIDSAHIFNSIAILQLDSLPLRRIEKITKHGITPEYLIRFKKHIDSLAFDKVLGKNNIVTYNSYISEYQSSKYMDTVIVLRDQLAFDRAVAENNYHSYREFIERYPQAKQVAEAKERFERLYYDERVIEDDLQSYISFLDEHPQSKYRDLAEMQILQLSTLHHTEQEYLDFAARFSQSKHLKIALDYAYHISNSIDDLHRLDPVYYDSLIASHEALRGSLFPIYKNGFGFIDTLGTVQIPIDYQMDTLNSSCAYLSNKYIHVAKSNGSNLLLSKEGKLIYSGSFDTAEDIGKGLLKITNGSDVAVIHLSGNPVLSGSIQEVKLIDGRFIAYKQNGLWGIASALGRVLYHPTFSSVESASGFIFLQRDDKYAITNGVQLAKLHSTDTYHFTYDDFELFEPNLVMVYEGNHVNLINHHLKALLPANTDRFDRINSNLLVESGSQHLLIKGPNYKIASKLNSTVIYNQAGAFAKKDQNYNIITDQGLVPINADSINTFGNHFITLYYGDSISFTYPNIRYFHKDVRVQAINGQDESYLIINRESLLDTNAKSISLDRYTRITSAGDSLFIVEFEEKKGIVNFLGDIILEASYDAIQRNDSSTFTLLRDGVFGIFDINKKLTVAPSFDKRLKKYGDRFYIGIKNNRYGLIDLNGATVVPFVFDEIRFWNDSTALVKREYQWMIYTIQENTSIIDGIAQYEAIADSDSEQTLKIYQNNAYGIIHSQGGIIIPSSFYNIYALHDMNTVIFVAEKYIEEADFYVVIYYNSVGEVIFKHAMESQYYQKVNCTNEH